MGKPCTERHDALCRMGKGCAPARSVHKEQRSATRVMPVKRANIIDGNADHTGG